ncbi:hypothetical protein GOP47_0017734 [Adiantum capillus-veneris]|uniref:Exocyst component Exo84 C-terminal domain-containing protein n=1 Tax=Adiantum capillus-veneris TaxID=13818 RepID=A0A9D4UFY7_ADICA|nr:hypothetical protein GOP47_0017734 [Adiantum capillus-veneris]
MTQSAAEEEAEEDLEKIAGLEGCLTSMQSLLLSKSAVVHSLIKCIPVSDGLEAGKSNLSDDIDEYSFQKGFLTTLDQLDTFLIERKTSNAVKALQQGEGLVCEARRKDTFTKMVKEFQIDLVQRRSDLVSQLVGTTKKISVHGAEVHAAIAALKQLGEAVMGHDLLLDLYHKRIKARVNDLHPSGTLFGGLYTAGLSQCVFSGIVDAVQSTFAIFGADTEFTSKLVLWVHKKTEDFVFLLEKHVLLVTLGLKSIVECLRIAHGHCLLVESHGLALCPFLTRTLRPTVLSVLQRCLEHIQEKVLYLTAADYWLLEVDPKFEEIASRNISRKRLCRSSGNKKMIFFENPEKLTSSAYHLDMLAMDFASDSAFLSRLHLEGVILNNLVSLFRFYIQLLLRSLSPYALKSKTTQVHLLQNANSLEQQVAILVNATVLAKDRFPCATHTVLQEILNDKELLLKNGTFAHYIMLYRPYLQQDLTRVQNSFSNLQKEKFLRESSFMLTSDVYTNLECSHEKRILENEKWRPSAFFEELYVSLTRISECVKKAITGWKKVVSIPLLNILKGVLLWLKNLESFWTGIEACKACLEPKGCVQMVFDLHFVVQFASDGEYCPKPIRSIISDLICSVQDIYAQHDYDPQSFMPLDEWFVREARMALQDVIHQRFQQN